MAYYYSQNKANSPVDTDKIVITLQDDYDPYYFIKFTLVGHVKTEWKYSSKELRDKELHEIREFMRDRKK